MSGQYASTQIHDPIQFCRLLERRISDLEVQLASDEVVRLRQVFSEPVLAEKAQQLIQQTFMVDRFQLQGLGMARKAGRRTVAQQQAEHQLEMARLWLLCLIRQCDAQPYAQIALSYAWVNTRRYAEAGQHIVDMYNDPTHPDRQQWVSLLIALRLLLINSSLPTTIVDEEIAFANLTRAA